MNLNHPAAMISACFIAVGCHDGDLSFNRASKVEIHAGLWLHRTSANMVTLTDADGMGLVNGNIAKISLGHKNLVIGYQPFDAADDAIHWVSIDLASKQVLPIGDAGSAHEPKDVSHFIP